MKRYLIIIFSFLFLCTGLISVQGQQAEIDSLVNKLRFAGRDWTNYSNPLVKIGEPAVPALIKNAEDKILPQWNRRVSMETLNQIHSELWIKPALKILFDKKEIPDLRNRATAGLRGFDLSGVKDELWELFQNTENQFYKSNFANLLLNADTALAYHAFYELYYSEDGHIQKNALLNLVQLRPEESTAWYLKGVQNDDWMTGNLAMDSLIVSRYFKAEDLLAVYNTQGVGEDVQWRIVFVFGHREEPESVPLLVEALQNESWLVHTEAAVGLCRFDKARVLEKMFVLKSDDRLFVRNNVAWIIQELKKQ